MARIRETLRRANALRDQQQDSVTAPPPYRPEEIHLRSADVEEIPFIEVGGRLTPMEASPSVLASIPKKVTKNQQAEQSESKKIEEGAGPATPAPEVGLTVLYISLCNQGR